MSRSATPRIVVLAVVLGLPIAAAGLGAQENLVPNPGFGGSAGLPLPIGAGVVNAPSGVPDQWRAFAVEGQIDLEIVDLVEDELFEGSPATRAFLLRVLAFGTDQGFDDDNGRFRVIPGGTYHAEFYVKTANADDSSQSFNFGFPLFNTAGTPLGPEPGGTAGNTATAEWQRFVAPTFTAPQAAVEGHISWRCNGDGGEDAILVALPFVPAPDIVYPTALTCTRAGADVTLTWSNNAAYESIAIQRDGAEIAIVDVTEETYTDLAVPEGEHTYQVLATVLGVADGPTCSLAVYVVAVGTTVSVDLGEVDLEDGLANSQRQDGTDGETAFTVCGPEADPREARTNLGSDDPTPDAPDGHFYFNVTDAPLKAQPAFRLEATVYDDPARAGAGLSLQYTNAAATGPTDFGNTFFPLENSPTRTLEGTDEWVVLTWDIPDAGFRSFQQGSSDFRLGVNDGGRLCIDKVVLTYFPLPTGLACRRSAAGVELTWESAEAYDAIRILKDGAELATLAGDATSYEDADVADGNATYQVLAVVGSLEGGPSCSIEVFILPEGTTVSVDLGETDVEDGLANSQRQEGTDGETAFIVCGPQADPREARQNLGTDDPTPDGVFYFNITDVAMKSQGSVRVAATVYDDPARAGVGLYLQYTNFLSTGAGDIPNTFFPVTGPPTRLLEGTDAWVVLTWDVDDAGFRSFQQGTSDFRIGVTDGDPICIDRVDVTFPSGDLGPPEPIFRRGDADGDGPVNITDAIFVLSYLFQGGVAPPCLDAADADDADGINITDGIVILNYLFTGGVAPAPPGPTVCGPDSAEPDGLDCQGYAPPDKPCP